MITNLEVVITEIVRALSVARKEGDILAIALVPSVANAPAVIERIVCVLFVRRDATVTGEIAVALSAARRAMRDESGQAVRLAVKYG